MIRDDVVLKLKDKRLATFAAYVPMLLNDSERAASEASRSLKNSGIHAFWDGKLELGKAYAKAVALPHKQSIAWDAYFLYGPKAVWNARPPKPDFWMHQLADDDKRLDGLKFLKAVKRELDSKTSGTP